MIQHYLKLAVRNLLKYKGQNLVSILGLALGLTCFALSFNWIHYEMTYDDFRQDADRLYLVRTNHPYAEGKLSQRFLPYPLADYLTAHFPEVEVAAPFTLNSNTVMVNGARDEVNFASADSAWLQLMEVELIEGSRNFMQPDERVEVAITEQLARKWFGKESPLGKEITVYNRLKRICAVIRAADEHTDFAFGLAGNPETGRTWWYTYWQMLLRVKPGTDPAALEAKINAHLPEQLTQVNAARRSGIEHVYLTPLRRLHYAPDFQDEREAGVQLRYIVCFLVAGVLVIVCTLVNYLTLFMNRMRVRQREMALRRIHGSGLASLVALLTTEFLLLLVGTLFVGCVLLELTLPGFMELTGIHTRYSWLYGSVLLFAGLVALVILAILVGILFFLLGRRTLSQSLRPGADGRSGGWLRKGSLVLQFMVCFAFIGGTVLMNLQLNHLRRYDLGMDFSRIGSFSLVPRDSWDRVAWEQKIRALPMVTEVLPSEYAPMVSKTITIGQCYTWDGLDTPLDTPLPVNLFLGREPFFRFYGITLLAGEWLNDFSQYREIILNESMVRRLGWTPQEAVGKHIYIPASIPYTVVGVVKDCYYTAPTLPVPCTGFVVGDEMGLMQGSATVLFRYKGSWEACRRAIEELYVREASGYSLELESEEECYDGFLRSESLLVRLLGFASLVCVLASLFGIYSLVTFSCEQRRKEIAIRKVNGARLADILRMFFREYLVLLGSSAIVAFLLCYVAMKHWIEGYTRQVAITPLPFLLIFVGVLLLVALCVGWRVWQAARQNPAEVVKSE